MTDQTDSLGDEHQEFHGLHCHFTVLIQGHGDDPVLEHNSTRALKHFVMLVLIRAIQKTLSVTITIIISSRSSCSIMSSALLKVLSRSPAILSS